MAQSSAAGTKRGSGRGTFIDSFLGSIDDFYEHVLQNLKPWMPAPPRLRVADEQISAEPVAASLVSTAISSQDGPEIPAARPKPDSGELASSPAE
ncbi:hypothetical protein [Actinoplanes sp. NPDC051494]|uniref:hypothetical protein n=1 Tax=Actinoplanes sp. NPDC051494 TaxID=3363907 RepID=UPI0037AAC097